MTDEPVSARRQFYRKFAGSPHRTAVEAYFRSLGDAPTGGDTAVASRSVFLGFTNRCGSTLVAARMAGWGIFGPPSRALNYEYFNGDEVVAYCREHGIRSFVDYVSATVRRHRSARGFFASKVAIDQLVWLTEAGLIGDRFRRPGFVYVKRNNIVAQAVSLSLALQTRQWTSLHPPSTVVPVFNPNQIATFIAGLREADADFQTYFAMHGIAPLTVVYEEILAAPERLRAAVEHYFGEAFGETGGGDPSHVLPVDRQADALNAQWERQFRRLYPGEAEHEV